MKVCMNGIGMEVCGGGSLQDIYHGKTKVIC